MFDSHGENLIPCPGALTVWPSKDPWQVGKTDCEAFYGVYFSLTHFLRMIILIGRDTKTDKRREGMAMNVEIKGNKLIIEIDLETPKPSSSGKSLVVASTRGNVVTSAHVDGKPVTIGLNAYIKTKP